jgi:hypothetical protein
MNTNPKMICLRRGSGRRGDLAHPKAFASRDFAFYVADPISSIHRRKINFGTPDAGDAIPA